MVEEVVDIILGAALQEANIMGWAVLQLTATIKRLKDRSE
jgi:hypothetical protein